MFSDQPVPPEDRRSPMGGSTALWLGIAIALGLLALGLILPTLGEGRTEPGPTLDDDLSRVPAPVEAEPFEEIVSA